MGTDITIAAALCWFDEPPDQLTRCLTSLEGIADLLIALDGPWDPYPSDRVRSSEEEYRVIGAAGFPTIYGPAQRFESQIEKRNLSLTLATWAKADWILVIDADEHVVHKDPDRLRHHLAKPGAASVATIHSLRVHQGPRNVRRLYRAIPGMRYEKAHSGVRTPDLRWLSGDPGHVRLEHADDLSPMLRIFHEQGVNRPQERQHADATFQRLRTEQRLENWA